MVVRVRNFSRTALANDPQAVNALIEAVIDEVDTFLSTLSINNVCDVRTSLVGTSKYGNLTTYEALVYYLE